MRRSFLVVGVCLFGFVVAGCGGEAGGGEVRTAGSDLPEIDACRLFTAEDATAVLGAPAVAPEGWRRLDSRDETTGVALSNCMYAASGTYRTAHVVVTYAARQTLPATYDGLKSAVASGAGGALSGLSLDLLESSEPATVAGELAYWTPDLGTLTVLARKHYMISATVDPKTAGATSDARAAAEKAAVGILNQL